MAKPPDIEEQIAYASRPTLHGTPFPDDVSDRGPTRVGVTVDVLTRWFGIHRTTVLAHFEREDRRGSDPPG